MFSANFEKNAVSDKWIDTKMANGAKHRLSKLDDPGELTKKTLTILQKKRDIDFMMRPTPGVKQQLKPYFVRKLIQQLKYTLPKR